MLLKLMMLPRPRSTSPGANAPTRKSGAWRANSSPPLLARIRDSSKATVLTEPLAYDAGGHYGGSHDGDSAGPATDRAGAAT
jgi:hypothetical protein